MSKMVKNCLLFCVVTVSLCEIVEEKKEIVAFPETEADDVINYNKSSRVPLFAPKICPQNQLLYPGNQKADWICDCSPGFVYYPPAGECFAVYRRGPCQLGEFLILEKEKIIPLCVKNPCFTDGSARYKGFCYSLDKPGGPCSPTIEGPTVFGVNTSTLELDCLLYKRFHVSSKYENSNS